MATPASKGPTTGIAGDDTRLRRDLGTIGLMFSAIGSMIGSGWLFGALNASQLAGPASVISWAVGAVIIALIGLVYAELGTMFPHAGGVARYPHYSFGSFASYTTGWVTWIAAATVAPVEVLAALTYATNYIPFLTHEVNGTAVLTGPGYGVATGLMLLFSLVNIMGIRWFARANNIIVWWKLAIIILVIVVFLSMSFDGGNFTSHGFAPFGAHGIFTSLPAAGIVFSYLGFRQGVELAGETKNPKRNVPLTLVGSVLIVGVIYIALQVAFIGAVPDDQLSGGWANVLTNGGGVFGPLAFIAGTIGLVWLSGLLYADAFISPADTGMIYLTVTSRLSYAMGRNRNAPKSLANVSGRGVPWVSVILAFVVGLIFFLPFPSWAELVGFVTSFTVLSFGSGSIVLLAMRRQLPNVKRPFKLPGGPILPFLAFWASNLVVYWSGWNKDWRMFVTVLIGFVVLGINEWVNRGKTPKFDFRHGWWILVWFGGLCLLSWLGNYPSPDEGEGNLGVLPYPWLVLAVFSALIMWLGVQFRLPNHRAQEIVRGLGVDIGEGEESSNT